MDDMFLELRKIFRKLGVALNLRDPPHVPAYGWSYFDHLVAVYVNLNVADQRAADLIKKSRESPDDLTWGDIFLMENINFSLLPPETVNRSAWILRERFREIACTSVYNKYIASGPPEVSLAPDKLPLLKADLTRVLDVLHWHYSLIPMRERIRKTLTSTCLWMVVAYTLGLAAILIWCRWHGAEFLAMLTVVLYAGIIGGFVSSQRRMEAIPSDGDPLITVFGLDSSGYYLWLSPLLGAIFAVVLTAMFIAGIFKGALFPDFYVSLPPEHHGLPFFYFTWNTLPKSSEEYAKLMIWAFLAGFAERLVPDSLDRLATKLDPDEKPKGNTPVPVVPGPKDQGVELPPPPVPAPEPPKPQLSNETIQDALHTGQGQVDEHRT
jgi:hypothetical protein